MKRRPPRNAPTASMVNLRAIPELIDRARAVGHPIVVEDPGTDHGRALVLTIGATIRPRRRT